jgi:hypothetical protein
MNSHNAASSERKVARAVLRADSDGPDMERRFE